MENPRETFAEELLRVGQEQIKKQTQEQTKRPYPCWYECEHIRALKSLKPPPRSYGSPIGRSRCGIIGAVLIAFSVGVAVGFVAFH